MLQVTRDDRGRLHVVAGSCPAILGGFLETDVGEIWEYAQKIAGSIERLRGGETVEASQFWGNVYELKLEPTRAVISNMYDEAVAPLVLPLSEIAEAFRVWTAELSPPPKKSEEGGS